MADALDNLVLPYGPGEQPGGGSAAPAAPTPTTTPAPTPDTSHPDLDKVPVPYKTGEAPAGADAPPPPNYTPLDKPMPAIWNRPTGQGIGGYLADTWAHQTTGAQQTAEDAARIAADTWSIGQGDRALSGQLTGPELEAERAKTEAAHARLTGISPAIDYASQGLGYMVPGPADLFGAVNLPAKGYAAASPYVAKALPAASKATQDAISRVAAYAGHSGLISAAQDIGHGIYDPAQVIGDTAVGATIGGALHGANEVISAGAAKVKDWWKGTSAPSGTPADITAANPTNPHAAKLEEWQNNMAVTGEPPKPQEVEAYGNQQFGPDKSKWPAEYQTILKSVQPREGLGIVPRAALGAGAFGLQHVLGLADSPTLNYGVQVGLQGAGEFGSRLYQGDPVARANQSISGSYPALTGWNSTGNADPFAWRDALHKGLALPLAQPQNQ